MQIQALPKPGTGTLIYLSSDVPASSDPHTLTLGLSMLRCIRAHNRSNPNAFYPIYKTTSLLWCEYNVHQSQLLACLSLPLSLLPPSVSLLWLSPSHSLPWGPPPTTTTTLPSAHSSLHGVIKIKGFKLKRRIQPRGEKLPSKYSLMAPSFQRLNVREAHPPT